MNPSRQVRTHRQIAEAMEKIWGERASEHPAEIAYHYSRSAALPGAERGAIHAVAAADRAGAAYAYEEVVAFLKLALELLPPTDPRRPRLLGRLGLSLTWTLNPDEALKAASEAGDLIAVSEGETAAADYLAEAGEAMGGAGFMRETGTLSVQGLRYVGTRRDRTWVTLTMRDLVREEVEDPNYLGIPVDSPRRREFQQIIGNIDPRQLPTLLPTVLFESRAEILTPAANNGFALVFFAGEYPRGLSLWENDAIQREREARIAQAVQCRAQAARCHTAVGNCAAASHADQKGRAAGARLPGGSPQLRQLVTARGEMCLALDEHWEKEAASHESFFQNPNQSFAVTWFQAAFRAGAAQIYAHL